MRHIQGHSGDQTTLFPESLDEYITDDHPVRFLDAFVKAKAKVSAANPVK